MRTKTRSEATSNNATLRSSFVAQRLSFARRQFAIVLIANSQQRQALGDEDAPFVDFQDTMMGWTPLHLACVELHLDAIKELLDGGANPTIADDVGDRPLDVIPRKDVMSKKRSEIRKVVREWGKKDDVDDLWGVSSDDDFGSASDYSSSSSSKNNEDEGDNSDDSDYSSGSGSESD